MKKSMMAILFSLFFVGAIAVEGQCFGPDGDDLGSPISKENREKIRQRIETIKIWKLTKALDLDANSAAVLFPLMNKYDKKRSEIQHDIRKNLRELKQGIEIHDDTTLSRLMNTIEQNHRELQELKDREWEEMKSVLTVGQQAKLIIFRINFEREIRKIISETRKDRFKKTRGERGEKFSRKEIP